MRFAYIDTRGNEVTIPSVDALRLRIELGAILDDTQFHDANTGKWAPAGEHEIYRTLKRELDELDAGGFAPPPPGMEGAATLDESAPPRSESAPPATEPAAPPTEPAAPPAEPAPPVADDLVSDPAVDAVPPNPGGSEQDGSGDDDFGLGVSLELAPEGVERDQLDATPADAFTVAGAPGGEVLEGLGDIELSGDWDEGGEEGAASDESVAGASHEPDALELEPALPEVEAPDPAGPVVGGEDLAEILEDTGPPAQFAMSPQEDLMGSVPEPGLMGDADTMGNPEDLEALGLEPTLDDSYDAEDSHMAGDVGGLELEAPLSEYEADQPPAWTQESTGGDGPGLDDDGFGAAAGGGWDQGSEDWNDDQSGAWDDPAAEDEWDNRDVPPPPARGEPPARPSSRPRNAPPQRKLTRARTPGAGRVVLLIVGLAAIGGGGWYGYQTFFAGSGAASEQGPPLPEIPAALMPQMRQFSDQAVGSMAEQVAQLPERASIPGRPASDWLTGEYLAGASGYASIPEYWSAVADYVDAVEREADAAFREALDAEIQAASLSESDAGLIRSRAMAGWQAAAADRSLVYGQLRGVATAALDLHQFLTLNEDQIEYRPVADNTSMDARLEASAASPELAEAMRDGVDAITDALDDLGYLDTIQTDGLLNAFLGKLEATPVR